MSTLLLEEASLDRLNTVAPDNPYPGLRPFVEEEEALFFGREGEIAAILGLLEKQQLVVVHGSSGCGKSSLVRAGVVPIFRMDALAHDTEARVVTIRPADGGGPIEALARRLEHEFPWHASSDDPDATQSWADLLATSDNWRRDISVAARRRGATLCLIIDQFEEIFAIERAGRAAEVRRIVEFLVDLDEPAPPDTALGKRPLSVILTMRSDYLGDCAMWQGFAEAVNRCQYLVPRLSTLALLRSINEPARMFGGRIDPPAIERLLPVVTRSADGLPILQHALMRAWDKAHVVDGIKVIDLDAIEATGGVDRALSLHADEAFATATRSDPAREAIGNRIFRSLSDLDSDGRIIRRSLTLADLITETGDDSVQVEAILDVFRSPAYSMIAPYLPRKLRPGSTVTVSHEALLRQWQRIIDGGLDADGRWLGLVYREAQDGMIARSLSVQAQRFVRKGTGVLSAAATEQQLPWFREVELRPCWLARYPLQRGQHSTEDWQSQWADLSSLIAASEANLEEETERIKRSEAMVRELSEANASIQKSLSSERMLAERLKKIRIASWIFAIIILLLSYPYIESEIRKYITSSAKSIAAGERESLILKLANEQARFECMGLGKSGADCPPEVLQQKRKQIEADYDTLSRPNPAEPQTFSPFGMAGFSDGKPAADK